MAGKVDLGGSGVLFVATLSISVVQDELVTDKTQPLVGQSCGKISRFKYSLMASRWIKY